MSVQYRYEEFDWNVDNSLTVKILAWNSDFPEEQVLLILDFAAGASVSSVETRTTQAITLISALKRTEP